MTREISTLHEHVVNTLPHLLEEDCIHQAGSSILAIIQERPSAVRALAHKKLHVFPFKDVPLCWRRTYEEACLWEVAQVLRQVLVASSDVQDPKQAIFYSAGDAWITQTVALCDSAIIFSGAPQRRGLIDTILDTIDDQVWSVDQELLVSSKLGDRYNDVDHRPTKRRRANAKLQQTLAAFPAESTESSMPLVDHRLSVPRVAAPSLSSFSDHIRKQRTPMIITGCIAHWPAIDRWQNPSYWLSRTHGGRRLVPVELGRSYTDEGWGQRIMEFGDYLNTYVLRAGAEQAGPDEPKATGYLAQYDLLAQVPALRNDIAIPDYCFVDAPKQSTSIEQADDRSKQQRPITPLSVVSDSSSRAKPDRAGATMTHELSPALSPSDDDFDEPNEPAINLWLGPAGTVSPAHHDPHENVLAQVVGRKYVRLFAPDQGPKMYPMGYQKSEVDSTGEHDASSQVSQPDSVDNGVDMHNTSQVDVGAFLEWSPPQASTTKDRTNQLSKFPQHAQAQYIECILEAGECLYIPRGRWHYVRSLTPSCSVSFWWD